MMTPGFSAYVSDILGDLGDVSIRPMFGGGGVYSGGVMFALIADDCLYFKVDDANKACYEQAGANPFTYSRKGKTYAMSYYLVPEDILEDDDLRMEWARQAWDAARRGKNST